MHPILFDIVLGPTGGTVVLLSLALVLPGLFAWRARKDAEEGLVEKNRWKKVLAGGVVSGLLVVTVVIKPWEWAEPLSIPLHSYGFMIAAGFVGGIIVAVREAKRQGLDPAHVMDMSFWALLFGLIGSRVLFIIVNADQYFGANFMTALELGGRTVNIPTVLVFWRGGLVFFGGFIGAALAVVWHMHRHRLNAWRYSDAVILGLPLGHFLGRMGCFAAGCCFGKPCPHAGAGCAHFPSDSLAYAQTEVGTHVQIGGEWFTQALYPTQLFEAGAVLLIFFFMLALRSRKRFDGQLIVAYLILYPIARSIIEVFRGDFGRGMLLRIPPDNPVILSTSQLISILVAAAGVTLIIYRLRQRRSKRIDTATGAEAA